MEHTSNGKLPAPFFIDKGEFDIGLMSKSRPSLTGYPGV